MEELLTKVSAEALTDYLKFKNSSEDGMFLLLNSQNISTDDVIKRFQTSHLDYVFESGLKISSEWSAEFLDVRKSVGPLSAYNKFSSFAIMEDKKDFGSLRYPLFTSFALRKTVFANKTFPGYHALKQKVSQVCGVKIIEDTSYQDMFEYKRSGIIKAILKRTKHGVLNLCRRVFKKDIKNYKANAFSGRIRINSNLIYGAGSTYRISEQERFTKILDGIVDVAVKRYAKKKNIDMTSDERFAARMCANVLLARAVDYGSYESNFNVEQGLTLQFSNVLARLGLSQQKLKQISSAGMDVALHTINALGISYKQVLESVKNSGYKFDTPPNNIREALTPKVDQTQQLKQETKTEQRNEEGGEKPDDKFSKVREIKTETKEIKITKTSVARYIDNAIAGAFLKAIEVCVEERYADSINNKQLIFLDRKYNFLDHSVSFYYKNKNLDNTELIRKELEGKIVADNNYAHFFANAFIELRNYIVKEIFKDKDYILKGEGRQAASIVNDFMKEKYGQGLATFASQKIKSNIQRIFEQIDSNSFETTSFVDEAAID